MSEKYIVAKETSGADHLAIKKESLNNDLRKNLNTTELKKVEGKINSIVVNANNVIKDFYKENEVYEGGERKDVQNIASKIDNLISSAINKHISSADNFIKELDSMDSSKEITSFLEHLEKGLALKVIGGLSGVMDSLAREDKVIEKPKPQAKKQEGNIIAGFIDKGVKSTGLGSKLASNANMSLDQYEKVASADIN